MRMFRRGERVHVASTGEQGTVGMKDFDEDEEEIFYEFIPEGQSTGFMLRNDELKTLLEGEELAYVNGLLSQFANERKKQSYF